MNIEELPREETGEETPAEKKFKQEKAMMDAAAEERKANALKEAEARRKQGKGLLGKE